MESVELENKFMDTITSIARMDGSNVRDIIRMYLDLYFNTKYIEFAYLAHELTKRHVGIEVFAYEDNE